VSEADADNLSADHYQSSRGGSQKSLSRTSSNPPSSTTSYRAKRSSRKARRSLPPGSVLDSASNAATLIFKHISDNNYKRLQAFLDDQGNDVDVVEIQESRQYSALAFAAFKNHTTCFKLLYQHGCKYNLPLGKNKKPIPHAMAIWADTPTDEQFTALHFATYHGNFELIKLLVDEMHADINVRNMYGAHVLHIAAQGD